MIKINFNDYKQKWIVFLGYLILSFSYATAQDNTRLEFVVPSRFEHIEALNDGVLIMRLNSNRKKMEVLASLAATESTAKKSYQEKLDKTRFETETFNQQLAKAFKQNYFFSKVVYIYDFQVPDLKKLPVIDVITNMETGERDLLELNGTDWYLLSDDNTFNPGPESYRLFDTDFQQMPKGFPGHWRKNDFWHVLIGIFNHNKSKHRDMDLMLKSWNMELFQLYSKAKSFRMSVYLVTTVF